MCVIYIILRFVILFPINFETLLVRFDFFCERKAPFCCEGIVNSQTLVYVILIILQILVSGALGGKVGA